MQGSILTTEIVPEGTVALRIFDPGSDPQKDPISFVGMLKPHSSEVVELGLALGVLSAERYLLIAKKAHELGYSKLIFHMTKGKRSTRWATKTHTDDLYDHYSVDLDLMIGPVELHMRRSRRSSS